MKPVLVHLSHTTEEKKNKSSTLHQLSKQPIVIPVTVVTYRLPVSRIFLHIIRHGAKLLRKELGKFHYVLPALVWKPVTRPFAIALFQRQITFTQGGKTRQFALKCVCIHMFMFVLVITVIYFNISEDV